MQTHLERFIRFLAAEKGLSTAYQLSVRQTLEEFARFLETEDTGSCPSGHRYAFGISAAFAGPGDSPQLHAGGNGAFAYFFPVAGRNGNIGKRSFRISGNAPGRGCRFPMCWIRKLSQIFLEALMFKIFL